MELVKNDIYWFGENAALTTFLGAKDYSHGSFGNRRHNPREPETFIPCHQAGETDCLLAVLSTDSLTITGIWLYKWFVARPEPDTFPIDERLYEHFVTSIPLFLADPFEAENHQCYMLLRHPTRPTAEPALLHITSWPRMPENSEYMQSILTSKHSGIVGFILTFVRRAAQMLHGQGDLPAAKRMLDAARQTRPDLFTTKRIYDFSNDPTEHFARAQPPTPPRSHAPERSDPTQASERAQVIKEAYKRQGYS